MRNRDYLTALTTSVAELQSIAEQLTLAQGQRAASSCPGWAVTDVFGHLGSIQRWTVDILANRSPAGGKPAGGKPEASQPWPTQDTVPWFLSGIPGFLAAMEDSDPEAESWTMGPPRTGVFWARRQAHEHTIHLWDVAKALATPATPLELPPGSAPGSAIDSSPERAILPEKFLWPELALDGVDEVFSVFVPRQIRSGRMPLPPAPVSFVATTAGSGSQREWTVGEGAPVVQVTAPAPALYLGLWGRLRLERYAVLEGDVAAAAAILSTALVP